MVPFMQTLLLLVLLICGACTSPVDVLGGHDGDDSRRRPHNWKEWKHDGLLDVGRRTENDDEDGDDPRIWLQRAKKYGYCHKNAKDLRRTFFFLGEGVLLLYVLNMLRIAYKSQKNNT